MLSAMFHCVVQSRDASLDQLTACFDLDGSNASHDRDDQHPRRPGRRGYSHYGTRSYYLDSHEQEEYRAFIGRGLRLLFGDPEVQRILDRTPGAPFAVDVSARVGLIVSQPETSLLLTPEDLRLAAERGVEVRLSIYLGCEDDEEDDDDDTDDPTEGERPDGSPVAAAPVDSFGGHPAA